MKKLIKTFALLFASSAFCNVDLLVGVQIHEEGGPDNSNTGEVSIKIEVDEKNTTTNEKDKEKVSVNIKVNNQTDCIRDTHNPQLIDYKTDLSESDELKEIRAKYPIFVKINKRELQEFLEINDERELFYLLYIFKIIKQDLQREHDTEDMEAIIRLVAGLCGHIKLFLEWTVVKWAPVDLTRLTAMTNMIFDVCETSTKITVEELTKKYSTIDQYNIYFASIISNPESRAEGIKMFKEFLLAICDLMIKHIESKHPDIGTEIDRKQYVQKFCRAQIQEIVKMLKCIPESKKSKFNEINSFIKKICNPKLCQEDLFCHFIDQTIEKYPFHMALILQFCCDFLNLFDIQNTETNDVILAITEDLRGATENKLYYELYGISICQEVLSGILKDFYIVCKSIFPNFTQSFLEAQYMSPSGQGSSISEHISSMSRSVIASGSKLLYEIIQLCILRSANIGQSK